MSKAGKTGSHEAYRRHGDRHDLARAFGGLWDRLCDLTDQWDDCLAAVVVSNRDGLIGAEDAKEIASLSDEINDLSKRFHATREHLEDLLRESA